MKKKWTDEQIIEFMKKRTGLKNGFVTRDDEGNPITYEDYEDDGFVFDLNINKSNELEYFKLQ